MANSWDSTVNTEAYTKTLERAEKYALDNGYRLNPNIERVQKVLGLMTLNHIAWGKYLCPCKQSHPPDAENDVTCPCPDMDNEIETEGSCSCRLFFSCSSS